MKALRAAAAILFVAILTTSLLAQSDARKVLDRFKPMVGAWQGKSASGETSEVAYQIVGGGTAVMAASHVASEDMTSMFYVDTNRLLMTHFCPSGNQPRMGGHNLA
jgi:hypothetical protein